MLGGEQPVDMDFTSVTNLFIELGHTVWSAMKNTQGPVSVPREAVADVFLRHLQDTSLKDQGVEDIFTDWLYRKMWESQVKQTMPATK